jgi:hypothetical protein
MTSSLPLPLPAGMTPGERDRVLAHFQMTEQWLRAEVRGLSHGEGALAGFQ